MVLALGLALGAAACMSPAPDFSGGIYPDCLDGECALDCACLGDVCVPDDKFADPASCKPCASAADCDDGVMCTQDNCLLGTHTCNHVRQEIPGAEGTLVAGSCTNQIDDDCDGDTDNRDADCQGCQNADECEDGNPCTVDACDAALGTCTHTNQPIPGAEGLNVPGTCDNGLDDDCDGLIDGLDLECMPCESDMDCDDGNECTSDTCAGANCSNQPTGWGGPCDDGLNCSITSTCDDLGQCQAAQMINCDHVIAGPCWGAFCNTDPGIDDCQAYPLPEGDSCDDGDSCTLAEQCDDAGTCQAGGATICDDNDACTLDYCDPELGCQATPDPQPWLGEVCFDGFDDDCDAITDGCCGGLGQLHAAALHSLSTETNPIAVLALDLRENHLPDLVVISESAWHDQGNVQVFLAQLENGTYSGTYEPAVAYSVGTILRAATAADLNGDDILDLVVVTSEQEAANNLFTLTGQGGDGQGNGDLNFDKSYMICPYPRDVVTADFNSDGAMDIAVSCQGGEAGIQIMWGQPRNAGVYSPGDGHFVVGPKLNVTISPTDLAVGDFNEDGRPDLAALGTDQAILAVTLACPPPGNCAGMGFLPATTQLLIGINETSDLVVADFDKDGVQDVVISCPFPNAIVVVRGSGIIGHGNGFFESPYMAFSNPDLPATSAFDHLAAADLNQDGVLDLAVSDSVAGELVLLHGQIQDAGQPYQLSLADIRYLGNEPMAPAIADFNRDGIPDVAVPLWNTAKLEVLEGQGPGAQERPMDMLAASPFGVPHPPMALDSADFNRDGIPDLAAILRPVDAATPGGIWIGLGQESNGRGTGDFQQTRYEILAGELSDLKVADFNADEVPDLVVTAFDNNEVYILLGTRAANGHWSGTFEAPTVTVVGWAPSSVAVADLDRDGTLDLATANFDDQTISVRLAWTNAVADPFSRESTFETGVAPIQILAADLNEDGLIDLITASALLDADGTGTGSINVHLAEPDPNNDGIILWDQSHSHPMDGPCLNLGLGDFNEDGRLDLVALVWSDGAQGDSKVFLGLGQGSNGQASGTFNTFDLVGLAGPGATRIVPADFSGDQVLDLAVLDMNNNSISLFEGDRTAGLGNGQFEDMSQVPLPWMPLSMTAGRFDGNRYPDLMVSGYEAQQLLLLRAIGSCNIW